MYACYLQPQVELGVAYALDIRFSSISVPLALAGLNDIFEERAGLDIGSITVGFYCLIYAHGGTWVFCRNTLSTFYLSI